VHLVGIVFENIFTSDENASFVRRSRFRRLRLGVSSRRSRSSECCVSFILSSRFSLFERPISSTYKSSSRTRQFYASWIGLRSSCSSWNGRGGGGNTGSA